MSRWIGLTVLAMAVFGCQQRMDISRTLSFDRWCKARARIFCGMAEQSLQAGRLPDAKKKADQAVELAPKFAEARMVLGRIRIEQGAYISAVTELREACELDAESTQAQYLLGVALEKSGQIQLAVDAYKKSYELDERNIDAVMAVGEVLAINGRAAEGSTYVEDYLAKLETKPMPAMLELAGRLAMSAKQHKLAARHYRLLTRHNGDNVHWQEELASVLFADGQYARAAEALEARTRIKDKKAPAWVYAMLGDCYMAVSRPNRARLVYAEALAAKPASPELMVKMAQAYLATGDAATAGRIARKILKIAPGELEATLVLGYSLLRTEKPHEAERVLGAAEILYPRSTTLLCLLGRCHASTGDKAEAKKYYSQAVKVDPKCEVARKLFSQL